MSAGRFLWRTFVATEAAKPGHAMTVQMTSQTAWRSPSSESSRAG